MAMAKQGGGSNSNWEGMLKRWSLEQGTRRAPITGGNVFDHPVNCDITHRPSPKWRGAAQKMFAKDPPLLGYDIPDRVFDIACSFEGESESESDSEIDSESEDEVKKEVQDEVLEFQDEVLELQDEGEFQDEVLELQDEVLELQDEGEFQDEVLELQDEGEFQDDVQDELVEVQEEVAEVQGDAEDECEIQDESEFQDESESESESESEAKDKDKDNDKDKEDLLDELQAYVEFVDVAKVLYIDNCLSSFLRCVLSNKHVAGIRAKGAEVVTTMVQNNPTSQQLVIKEKGLKLLLHNFTEDPDATSRTKALGAISSLIRNNEPGVTAFRQANGYAALRDTLSSECVRFQREALKLIQYLLHENSSDCNIVTELGLPRIMMHLASNDDLEVRQAALRCLLILARDEGGNSGQLVKNDDKLKQVLQARVEGISAMSLEDLGAAREERQLVDSLWNACYNEPSSIC